MLQARHRTNVHISYIAVIQHDAALQVKGVSINKNTSAGEGCYFKFFDCVLQKLEHSALYLKVAHAVIITKSTAYTVAYRSLRFLYPPHRCCLEVPGLRGFQFYGGVTSAQSGWVGSSRLGCSFSIARSHWVRLCSQRETLYYH